MITQNELKEVLNYDEYTGIFTWKKVKKYSNKSVGDVAGGLSLGYVVIKVGGKLYKAHRLAWLYVYGNFPEQQIDHINGNEQDNRLCNLREANQSQNNYNRKLQKNNTSGVKGVVFNKMCKKWQVQLKINKELKWFGLFEDFELAALVANEARNKYHKEFLRD